MLGIKQYIGLKIQSKTGLNSSVIIAMFVTLFATMVAVVFIVVTGYIWLSDRYSPLAGALIIFVAFVVVTIGAAVFTLAGHRHASSFAEQALAKQGSLSPVQPTHLKTALQIANGTGWRKIIPIVGAGLLTAGLVRDWSQRGRGETNIAESY
jgi:hypothetical protein